MIPKDEKPGPLALRILVAEDSRTNQKLAARLLEARSQADQSRTTAARRKQVGTGERSEKIRTYNFPQSRVTDHRINLTVHQIESFMDGNLNPIIEPLAAHSQSERLKAETAAAPSPGSSGTP